MKRKAIVLLTAVSALNLGVAAAEDVGPRAGDHEITLSGTGSNDKNFDNGSFGLSGSWGQYLTDTWSWSVRQNVSYSSVADDDSINGSTRLGIDYNFMPGNRLRPFVGANIGALYGDNVNDTGIAGPELGLKYYIKPQTFVYLQTEYQFQFEDADQIDNQFDDGSWAHTIGFGINY